MKTNKEKNTEHERKELMRVRPKQTGQYEFEALTKVIRQWVAMNEQT
jgi:hypothetical protein